MFKHAQENIDPSTQTYGTSIDMPGHRKTLPNLPVGATGAKPLRLSKSRFGVKEAMNKDYITGFVVKCASCGVDAAVLLKSAQLTRPESYGAQAFMPVIGQSLMAPKGKRLRTALGSVGGMLGGSIAGGITTAGIAAIVAKILSKGKVNAPVGGIATLGAAPGSLIGGFVGGAEGARAASKPVDFKQKLQASIRNMIGA